MKIKCILLSSLLFSLVKVYIAAIDTVRYHFVTPIKDFFLGLFRLYSPLFFKVGRLSKSDIQACLLHKKKAGRGREVAGRRY